MPATRFSEQSYCECIPSGVDGCGLDVDAAAHGGLNLSQWGEPQPQQPGAFAFRMYRNYDGAGGRFGDVSVSASSSDQGQLSVFAAQRSSDKALTLMVVNKTGEDLTSALSVAGFNRNGTAQRYTYGPADLTSIVRGDDVTAKRGTIEATYPANSLTLLVLPGR